MNIILNHFLLWGLAWITILFIFRDVLPKDIFEPWAMGIIPTAGLIIMSLILIPLMYTTYPASQPKENDKK